MKLIKLMAFLIALLVPAAAIAAGGCKEDKQKLCKDVVEAKAIRACLKQHAAELSEGCKAKLEAKGAEKSGKKAKAGKEKEQEAKPEANPAPAPDSDTNKLNQPTPSDDATKQ